MILFGNLKNSLYICNIIKQYNKMTIQEIESKIKELLIKVNSLQKEYLEKYPNFDISMPMNDDEKQLIREKALIWSEINNLVRIKNKLRKELVL